MASTHVVTAGSLYRKQEKNLFFKTKNLQKKLADRSKFKIPIGIGSGKKCFLYEMGGLKLVDIIEESLDGSIPTARRASLPLDAVLALQIFMPTILSKIEKGDVGEEFILDQKSKLIVITSRLIPTARAIFKATPRIFASIRYKYTTDEGEEGIGHGVSFSPTEFRILYSKIPEILAIFNIFSMNGNVYFEGSDYRVIYQEETKTFVILDQMESFQNEAFNEDSIEEAFVDHMQKKEKKKREKENARLFSEEITECKQMLFMKCVFFALISAKCTKFYSERKDDIKSDTDAEKTIGSLIFELAQIETCGIYCQAAYDCDIPMYSSLEMFQNVQHCCESRSFFMARLLDEKKISDEEKCYLAKIAKYIEK